MIKVSEPRSTARRALLRKRADMMPFMGPIQKNEMPDAYPRADGHPISDSDFHDYTVAQGDMAGLSFGDQMDMVARNLTDPSNDSVLRDAVMSNPLTGVPYNLLKARGNYLRAGDAAASGDLDGAADRHLESVGDGAMAALSIVPATPLLRYAPRAVQAVRGVVTPGRALRAAAAVGALDGTARVVANASPRPGTLAHALSGMSDAAHDLRSIESNADLDRVRESWASRLSSLPAAASDFAVGGRTATDGISSAPLRRAVESAEFWPGVGSAVTFANDYHANRVNGRPAGVSAARSLVSSLPGWRSFSVHETPRRSYRFQFGGPSPEPAAFPASTGPDVRPASAE